MDATLNSLEVRAKLATAKRWVIKIGSALLTNDGQGLHRAAIESWVAQIVGLQRQGCEVVLVSSGAVAEGLLRLKWTQRPTELHKLQAAAAVGQMGVIQTYESCFSQHGIHTAQILLTHDDLSSRNRYLNARSTLRTLLNLNVVPIVNENDTVATDEIRVGDNDTLGGLVTNLIEADVLVILTDQQGLFERDPRIDPAASLVQQGYAGDPRLDAMAGSTGGALGRGGMATKLRAAKLAARSGAMTLIVSGRIVEVLAKVRQGEALGTLLLPSQASIAARKQWLGSHLRMQGRLYLDEGATRALCGAGRSLLPIGVVRCEGSFARGDMVACVNAEGREVARGLVNYASEETLKIIRQPSEKIREILGYEDEPELIHRDNLVLV